MKKIFAFVLALALALSLAACGNINDNEVSVLWSGNGVVEVPNSLINALERAMYIENVGYAHYGANGSQDTQTKQATDALNAGCAALVVELVDASAAQSIVDAAKAKDVPVVFVNTPVDAAVVSSYAKCVSIVPDAESAGIVLGEKIFADLGGTEKKEPKIENYDRNGDGKLSCITVGELSVSHDQLPLEVISGDLNGLTEGTYMVKKTECTMLLSNGTPVELILVADDAAAQDVLKQLQDSYGFNSDKLTTHCIPIYTVGNEENAKSFLSEEDYEEDEWAALIYTTTDLIGEGQIAGAAAIDYDTTAAKVAETVSALLQGEAITEQVIAVSYTDD